MKLAEIKAPVSPVTRSWWPSGHQGIAVAVQAYISKNGRGETEEALLKALKDAKIPLGTGPYVERQSLEWADGDDGFVHVNNDKGPVRWFAVYKTGKVEQA